MYDWGALGDVRVIWGMDDGILVVVLWNVYGGGRWRLLVVVSLCHGRGSTTKLSQRKEVEDGWTRRRRENRDGNLLGGGI